MPQALLSAETKLQKPRKGNPAWVKGVAPVGARPWARGQSGNPGGKRGRFQTIQAMCRDASVDAAQKLVDLMDDPDPRVAGWAADKVWEKAWGKPKDYDPAAEQPDNPPIDPAQFSPQQRAQLRRMLELLLKAMPAELPPDTFNGETIDG